MGASTSNLKRLVKEEYSRKVQDRDFLVLDDILDFELSLSGWRLETRHMGVVLAIDRCEVSSSSFAVQAAELVFNGQLVCCPAHARALCVCASLAVPT